MVGPVCVLIHGTGSDSGGPFCHVVPYSFWSGVAGSFLVNVVSFTLMFYVHHTCHDSARCLRWGKFPAAGGTFKLCAKHHPDLRGHSGPRRDLIHLLHSRSTGNADSDAPGSLEGG